MAKYKATCDCNVIHYNVVENVRRKMPCDEEFFKLSDFFKVFSDNTRAKIICALHNYEMCVCDIAVLLNMTKSAVSHQLRILRDADLVRTKRKGRVVYYSLADSHVKDIYEKAVEHINEQ